MDKQHYPEPGGFLDQPYFFMSYVVPWIEQGYDEMRQSEQAKAQAQEFPG